MDNQIQEKLNIEQLPKEILLEIMQNLSSSELKKAALVNKR